MNNKDCNHYQEQLIGAVASMVNEERIRELNSELFNINFGEQLVFDKQQQIFLDSLEQVSKIRDFLKTPEHILGSPLQKHGEIAEVIEVNIRNAKSLLEQKTQTATFDGIGRTAPVDYMIDGTEVQSKFCHGFHGGSLDAIVKHMDKYQDFGRNESYYHIPKDQYEVFKDIVEGKNIDGLADKTIKSALSKIHKIEEESGKTFDEVVKPSISKYDDVQKGVVFKTVDGHEEQLANRNEAINNDIKRDAKENKQQSIEAHQPSWGEAAKVGAMGAAIGGAFSVGLCVYKKHKEGKKLTQYDTDDWKDLGVDFAKGGAKGGVTGVAIYGITNFSGMTAPLASAFVSTTFGVTSLVTKYTNNEISKNEFVEQGQILCFDSAVVALGATVGQTIIPIPIIGTLIGTFASKTLMSICKETLGKETDEIRKILDKQYTEALNNIDQAYRIAVQKIIAEYEKLGQITMMAFDFDRNAVFRFDSSIELALEYGVEDKKILKNLSDVEAFMLS